MPRNTLHAINNGVVQVSTLSKTVEARRPARRVCPTSTDRE